MSTSNLILDVRPVPPEDQFELINRTYRNLPLGGRLDLTIDHDPLCVYYTLRASEPPGRFRLTYLEDGPEVWRVALEKVRQFV